MSKGTPAFGKHQRITHIRCRRCGRHSYHINKKKCAACGFGKSPRMYKMSWKWKPVNRSERKRIEPKHFKPKRVHNKPRWGK